MIKELNETNVKVKGARLLTIAEFEEFEESIPVTSNVCWWLADMDDSQLAAYVEGDYREEDMFTDTDYPNTYFRVALDISNGEVGEQFVFNGYVFTVLSETLAISNNVIGPVKYYDDTLLDYVYDDEDVNCTINVVISSIFNV